MTGFGLGATPLRDGRVLVEIRSLNHRFLDVRVRLPSEIGDQTFFLEQLARERLSRGRYDIGVRVEGAALPPPRISLERARAAYRMLSELRDELAPGSELPLGAVLGLPEVVATSSDVDGAGVREALRAAFSAALAALDEMRRREGNALGSEIRGRLERARVLCREIAEKADDIRELSRTRLRARLERLVSDANVTLDPGRLETELAIMADRSDITEELVRLASHFDQLESLMASDDPVGRRLDFLLQELGREANTVGSKSQDSLVAHKIVELKSEIERMREQIQNVE